MGFQLNRKYLKSVLLWEYAPSMIFYLMILVFFIFLLLAAREHIELYAGLKGVGPSERKQLIEERLEAVRLSTVADVRAGTYSGGMKRRLSLVISTIGDPKVCVFA